MQLALGKTAMRPASLVTAERNCTPTWTEANTYSSGEISYCLPPITSCSTQLGCLLSKLEYLLCLNPNAQCRAGHFRRHSLHGTDTTPTCLMSLSCLPLGCTVPQSLDSSMHQCGARGTCKLSLTRRYTMPRREDCAWYNHRLTVPWRAGSSPGCHTGGRPRTAMHRCS